MNKEQTMSPKNNVKQPINKRKNMHFFIILLMGGLACWLYWQWPEQWYYWVTIILGISSVFSFINVSVSSAQTQQIVDVVENVDEIKQEAKTEARAGKKDSTEDLVNNHKPSVNLEPETNNAHQEANEELDDGDEEDTDPQDEQASVFARSLNQYLYQAQQTYNKDITESHKIYAQISRLIDNGIHARIPTYYAEQQLLQQLTAHAQQTLKTDASQNELQQALDTINIGFKYAFDVHYELEYSSIHRKVEHFFITWDTKAQLLIKLGRQTEAYELANYLIACEEYIDYGEEGVENSILLELLQSYEFIQWFKTATPKLTAKEKELLAKSTRIFNSIPKQVIPEGIDKHNTSVEFSVISHADARQSYNFPDVYIGPQPLVLVVSGDYYTHELVNQSWLEKQAQKYAGEQAQCISGVLFLNNLYVDNLLYGWETLILKVMGHTYVEHSIQSYSGYMQFVGDTYARLGMYGDLNHGQIECNSKLYTPYLIAHEHFMPRSCHQDFVYIEGGDECEMNDVFIGKDENSDKDWGWNYYQYAHYLFNPSIWDEDNCFSTELFFALLKKGENPFKEIQ